VWFSVKILPPVARDIRSHDIQVTEAHFGKIIEGCGHVIAAIPSNHLADPLIEILAGIPPIIFKQAFVAAGIGDSQDLFTFAANTFLRNAREIQRIEDIPRLRYG
jgi:hypothetical protein